MPEQSPVILIDLDRTLIDSSRLKEGFQRYFGEIYAHLGFSEADFSKWTAEYTDKIGSKTNFDPETLTIFWHERMLEVSSRLPKPLTIPSAKTLATDFNDFIKSSASDFLYQETVKTLIQLQQLGATLCLFSQGVEVWQLLKLTHSKLAGFFEKELQFVSSDKTSPDFLQKIRDVLAGKGWEGRTTWLVDDKQEVLSRAQAIWPDLVTFWIERQSGKTQMVENQPDAGTDQPAASHTRIDSLQRLVEHLQ